MSAQVAELVGGFVILGIMFSAIWGIAYWAIRSSIKRAGGQVK